MPFGVFNPFFFPESLRISDFPSEMLPQNRISPPSTALEVFPDASCWVILCTTELCTIFCEFAGMLLFFFPFFPPESRPRVCNCRGAFPLDRHAIPRFLLLRVWALCQYISEFFLSVWSSLILVMVFLSREKKLIPPLSLRASSSICGHVPCCSFFSRHL